MQDWPLTGRAAELRRSTDAVRRERGIVLAGAAGVGKTRLAREAAPDARWAIGTASARGIPLGALSPLISAVEGNPVQHAVEALSGGTLGIDDAHQLDDLSALVLHQLVASGAAKVIITVRTGEPTPDAVSALWDSGLLERVEIAPLPPEAIADLVSAVLGGPVDSIGATKLFSMTQGNALFLRQLVYGELTAGRLTEVAGVWRWTGAAGVSPALAEVVRARMHGLTDETREIIDMLSLSEPLGVDLLGSMDQAGELIRVERDRRRTQARLAHPLYGEVRRASIGQLRSRRLRGAIATALARTGGRRADDTLRRAVLALDSDLKPDPDLLATAAQAAVALLDLPLALRLARAAVDAGAGSMAQLMLANVLSWLSRPEEAEREFVALLRSVGSDFERTAATFARAATLFYVARDAARAESVIIEALDQISEPAMRAALTGLLAAFDVHLGRPEAALDGAVTALAVPGISSQGVVMGSFGVVAGLGLLGRADEQDEPAARAYAVADASPDSMIPVFGLAMLHVVTLRMAGYLEKASMIAADRRREGSEIPGPPQAYGAALVGVAELGHGRLDTAVRWLREARAGLRQDTAGYENMCLIGLAEAYAKLGDVAAARDALTQLAAQPHPVTNMVEADVLLVRAWISAAEGALTEALRLTGEAARLGQPAQELMALQTAAQFGDFSGLDRLRELDIDGPRAAIAVAYASAADDGDALSAVSLRWEEIGDLVAAADAAAQAAVAYGGHSPATARARDLAARCGGLRTPALAAAITPLPLTAREREIVGLAAQGLSNQQIAERLAVSVRTVEGHLYRASTKLGTANRADFAGLLGS